VALVGVQIEGEAALGKSVGAAQVFEAGERVAEGEDDRGIAAQAEALRAGAAGAVAGAPLSA
jgi:hypothetical protein